MKRVMLCALVALGLSALKVKAQEFKMSQVSLLVKDYEETLSFYTGSLGFVKTADMTIGKERWVTIAPPGQKGAELVLVKAETAGDLQAVGKQAGDRTLLVLETGKFDEIYQQYKDKNVHFITEVTTRPWGRQAELSDLYGNHLVLLELKPRPH